MTEKKEKVLLGEVENVLLAAHIKQDGSAFTISSEFKYEADIAEYYVRQFTENEDRSRTTSIKRRGNHVELRNVSKALKEKLELANKLQEAGLDSSSATKLHGQSFESFIRSQQNWGNKADITTEKTGRGKV